MKNKANNIVKFLISFVLLFGLFSFASYRNKRRHVEEIYVTIFDNDHLLVTRGMIKKLLIESLEKSPDKSIEKVRLSELEKVLKSMDLLEKVDIFLSVRGDLYARVHQRVPILRILSDQPFYIDSLGHKMPLSKIYSPKLPVYWNWDEKTNLKEIHTLARKIHDDSFLTKNIVSFWKKHREYIMKMRYYDLNIYLGSVRNLDRKIDNFKAFYQRMLEENNFNKYTEISLKYKGQVVCKKK